MRYVWLHYHSLLIGGLQIPILKPCFPSDSPFCLSCLTYLVVSKGTSKSCQEWTCEWFSDTSSARCHLLTPACTVIKIRAIKSCLSLMGNGMGHNCLPLPSLQPFQLILCGNQRTCKICRIMPTPYYVFSLKLKNTSKLLYCAYKFWWRLGSSHISSLILHLPDHPNTTDTHGYELCCAFQESGGLILAVLGRLFFC